MKIVIFMFFFCFLIPTSSSSELNNEPIIGILSQEISPSHSQHSPAYNSYIAASYVKAVESSGARVVPVFINKPYSYYWNVMKSVNGLLLPGGGTKNGRGNLYNESLPSGGTKNGRDKPYYESIRTVYNIAKELNDNGTIFPILGVCLGYEILITVANNDEKILKNCSVFYENYPISFTRSPFLTSLFSRISSQQRDTLQNYKSTMNWHTWCAYVDDFKNSSLNNDWVITSTSISNKNIEFIASVEHERYPFYGVQFHPEKVAFEWKNPDLPRGEKILQANRYFYDQLVYLAKSNNQTFTDEKEQTDALIYNYSPHYDHNPSGTPFIQLYLF